ncbi:hypothetical protein FRB94_011075 [Tulasnella sp. JGI-2019a]|nr:hypothetical protein FRB94_011075 [Tulasnella sp. JGI-2019a]
MSSIQLYPELWQTVFDRLDHEPRMKADLRNVSKTSRLFHALVEPLLFGSILLKSSFFGIDAQTAALIRDLTSRIATRQWVKSIEIMIGDDDYQRIDIANIFVKLHNLREIAIYDSTLTDGMASHLLHLPRSFAFICVDASCTTEAVNLASDTRNLRMTALTVDGLGGTNTIPLIKRLASGPHLSILHLNRDLFHHTALQNPNHHFDSLRHLQVYEPGTQTQVERFLSFLASCPLLSHLTITTRMHSGSFSLPSTSVPHLESFDGSYSLAALFVIGRPLASLSVQWERGGNLWKKSLSKLVEGSVPLRGLSMVASKWYNDVLLDIAEYFPALQSLKLYDSSRYSTNWMRERLASDIQGLLELRILVITGDSPDDDLVLDHSALKSPRSGNGHSSSVYYKRSM